jgi:hypothetical protein
MDHDPLNMALMTMNDGTKKVAGDLRGEYISLAVILETLPKGRESSLAKTNLEQSLMWAIKALCLEDNKEGNPIPSTQ